MAELPAISTEKKMEAQRAYKEAMSLLMTDPRQIKKLLQQKTLTALCYPVTERPPIRYETTFGKDGEERQVQTLYSEVEQEAYDYFVSINEVPTESELADKCYAILGRTSNQHRTFMRDTAGMKPVDESKMDMSVGNKLAQMSDEELYAMAQFQEHQDEFNEWLKSKTPSAEPTCIAQSAEDSNE